jgi:hypothetical protein
MRALRFAIPVHALLVASLASGCILTTSDDGSQNDDDTGGPSTVTLDSGGTSTVGTTAIDDSGTDDGVDGTDGDSGGESGGPTGECTDNLVLDPGFEAGTPSRVWDEASVVFGTPICNADCTDEPGAGPYAGDWYAWYGGLEALEDGTPQPDVSSVTQTINLPAGDNAWLSFRFEINAGAGTGDDVFAVDIDGMNVFMATDAEIDDYAEYRHVQVDVSAFADGGDHTLVFHGDLAGIEVTNFFLDEIELVSCVAPGSESSSSGGSEDTGGSDGSGGSEGSGGSGESSGSDGSGSDSSSSGG